MSRCDPAHTLARPVTAHPGAGVDLVRFVLFSAEVLAAFEDALAD